MNAKEEVISKKSVPSQYSDSNNDFKESDIIPGTVHLVDISNVLHVKKDENSKHNIILIPPPSNNPNDPLRWSKLKKNLQFFFLFIWSFFQALNLDTIGPYYSVISKDLNTGITQLNISSALGFLFLGVGVLVLQPTALKLGRRFVYLMCTILAIVGNVIGSQAKSINYLYGAYCIMGLSAAPVDSLVEISTTDVFFIHERASKLSFLILALYAGSFLGPAISGFVGHETNFKRLYWIQCIILGVMFIAQIFLMEDTTFHRESEDNEKEILEQIRSLGETTDYHGNNNEKLNPNVTCEDVNEDNSSVDYSIKKRKYWQRLRLFELEYNDPRSWLTIFLRPLVMCTFPSIIWGGIVYGAQMMWLSLLVNTQSQVYSGKYGFSTSSTGLSNFATFIGTLVGMFYGGYFVDWLSIKLAERNNGILEPEFRLWAMIVPTILNAGGILAYGLASNAKAAWPIPIVIGQGLMGFSMSSTGGIILSFAIDSYPNLASEGLVLMLFIRNMIGCGFTFAIQPWIKRDGMVVTTWLMFMLAVVINGSFIIIIMFGKDLRRMTTKYYYKVSDPNFGNLLNYFHNH